LPVNVSANLEFGQARLTTPETTWSLPGASYCCDNADAMAAMAAAGGVAPPGAVAGPTGLLYSGYSAIPETRRMALFTVPTRQADQLRGRTVGVEAPLRFQFTRHRLVGDIPLRAGAAFRTDSYLLEILSVEARAGVALCRFARFPALASLPGPPLRYFVGTHTGERVLPAMSYRRQETELDGGGIGWTQGRTRVARLTLPIGLVWAGDRGRPPPLPTRLYIVESRPAGEVRTTIVARDVRVIDTSDLPGPDRRY
jgi:hypothetical protein